MNNKEEEKSIFVTSPSLPSLDEYVAEICSIFEKKWVTNMGEKHEELEKKLQNYLDVDNVSLVSNGHMALEIALQSLEMAKGGEIITTPFTFVSTTNAIIRAGFTPVFCDINTTDYTIDVDSIENLITEKTVAILPVHVYGNICDVERIQRIAEKYGLKVIYDAAHAFGVKYKNKGIANYGDISIFSFHATKVYNSIEGGAICTNRDEIKNKVYMLRDFGIKDAESVEYIAPNAKMDEFRAAMGICNLRRVDDDIEKRRVIVEKYRENLSKITGITFLNQQKGVQRNYAYLPITLSSDMRMGRDELVDNLQKSNIFVRKYFYPIVSEFDCYKSSYNACETPIALDISKRVITLPLYPDLSMEDVERVCYKIWEMEVK